MSFCKDMAPLHSKPLLTSWRVHAHTSCAIVEFTFLQVDITEDQTTPEQLRDAFRVLSNDKVDACALL